MTVGEGRAVAKEMTMEVLRLIAAFVHSAGLLRRSPHPYFLWQNFWIIGAVRLVEVQQPVSMAKVVNMAKVERWPAASPQRGQNRG